MTLEIIVAFKYVVKTIVKDNNFFCALAGFESVISACRCSSLPN